MDVSRNSGREQTFDLGAMRERLQLDNDLLLQVLSVFLEGLPVRRQELAGALNAGESALAAHVIHSLKGTARNLAFDAVAEAAERFEAEASSGDGWKAAGAVVLDELNTLEVVLLEVQRSLL